MPLLSEAQIRAMMPLAGDRLTPHLPYINPAMQEGGITTPRRIAAFMAEVAHESGEYKYMREIADGSAYEGRLDLGNTQPGDGRRYPGRGAIQNTGRGVARALGMFFKMPFEDHPELMELPEWATRVSVWFWNDKAGGLSPLADVDWFVTISRFVNGGDNGLKERIDYWTRNRRILGLPAVEPMTWDVATAKAFQSRHDLVADGDVGPKTLAAWEADAVKVFQCAHGLLADGKVGNRTLAALRSAA